MERLTRTDWKEMVSMECCGQKDYCIRRREGENACLNCIVPKLYVRVAAYEDTGLTTEGVEYALRYLNSTSTAEIKGFEGVSVDRLLELAAADKEGRVVIPPCKVGDTVYFVNAKQILEFTVVGYAVDETGISWVYSEHVDKTGHTNERTFSPDRFGKNTFLTREEAEKALQGMEGNR